MREERRSVKWILIISVIMLIISSPSLFPPFIFFFGLGLRLQFYHLPRQFTPIELLWYLVNRLDAPLFVLTITVATLYTTGFGREELLYKLSIYLFILSMMFFFITFAQMLIGAPYRY